MKAPKYIEVEPRNCESCGSDHLEFLWRNDFAAETRNYRWQFQIRNVICTDCGFVFVSPVPASGSLNQYYGDSYAQFANQAPDYRIESRMAFIKRNLGNHDVFVEIGSNRKSGFHVEVDKIFADSFAVELNDSVEKDYGAIEDIPRNFADMAAHYFVLEHIPHVRDFIKKCRDILKPGGVMILEVPDIELYPHDCSALILHEHLNHFSMETAEGLACSEGFELVDASRLLCSRPFGFAAAFRKVETKVPHALQGKKTYRENKTAFLSGVEKIKRLQEKSDEIYSGLLKPEGPGNKTVLWGAGNELLRFLNSRPVPGGATVIDSNPLKKDFSDAFHVYQPHEAAGQIVESEQIILFTRSHQDILQLIEREYGKQYPKENILVLC